MSILNQGLKYAGTCRWCGQYGTIDPLFHPQKGALKSQPKGRKLVFTYLKVYTHKTTQQNGTTQKKDFYCSGLLALRRARRPCQVSAITAAQSNFTCSCSKWKSQISVGNATASPNACRHAAASPTLLQLPQEPKERGREAKAAQMRALHAGLQEQEVREVWQLLELNVCVVAESGITTGIIYQFLCR